MKPHGEWNEGRIVCQGTIIQHWLNGEKVIDFDYSDPRWFHELEVLREGAGWPATVTSVREIGAIVRLELAPEGHAADSPLEAEISRERLANESFKVGQKVQVRLRRWQIYPEAA